MSTAQTDSRPAYRTSTDCPTEVLPTVPSIPARRSILCPSASDERAPLAGWRDQTPTEPLPAIGGARPRVSTSAKPTGGREVRRRPHLRAALAALALAAAILIPMQLYATQGISSARQAALATAQHDAAPAAAPSSTMSGQTPAPAPVPGRASAAPMSGQTPAQPDWVTEDTHAPYDRTNPHASPLSLPSCTTSPSTPLPCLATISPDSARAVILEEDASLTALVRR